MTPEERATRNLLRSRQVLKTASTVLAEPLARAARVLSDTLLADGRILCCGNGGSATQAEHFATELLDRHEHERPGLAAIALTASAPLTSIAGDHGYEEVFARQIRALGRPGDSLLVLTTGGDPANVVTAVEAARDRGLTVIALTGRTGGMLSALLDASDVELAALEASPPRVMEVHLAAIHCLCDLIDARLLGLRD